MGQIYNKKITQFIKNPGKMYIKMNDFDLDEFFNTGYTKNCKNRCLKAYNISDFKRGILQSNHLVKTDEDRNTVDLMMFALGKIEDLQFLVKDMEQIIDEITKEIKETEANMNIEEDN